MVLLTHLRLVFALSHGTYGSPQMTRELQDNGLASGRRTARLMREIGLRGRHKRRFKRTTAGNHNSLVVPNLLDQDFSAENQDRKWGSDIPYIWTHEGWPYLTVVIELFTRRVVG